MCSVRLVGEPLAIRIRAWDSASRQRHVRQLEQAVLKGGLEVLAMTTVACGYLSRASVQTLQAREFRRWGAWCFPDGKSCISPCFGRHRVNHQRSRTHLATTGPGLGHFFVPTRSDSKRIDGCKNEEKGPGRTRWPRVTRRQRTSFTIAAPLACPTNASVPAGTASSAGRHQAIKPIICRPVPLNRDRRRMCIKSADLGQCREQFGSEPLSRSRESQTANG